MAIQRVQKYTGEKRLLTFDFSNKLAVGANLSGSPTVSSSPSGLTLGTPARVSPVVQVTVDAGSSLTSYTVTCTCSTDNGEVLVGKAVVAVDDRV